MKKDFELPYIKDKTAREIGKQISEKDIIITIRILENFENKRARLSDSELFRLGFSHTKHINSFELRAILNKLMLARLYKNKKTLTNRDYIHMNGSR